MQLSSLSAMNSELVQAVTILSAEKEVLSKQAASWEEQSLQWQRIASESSRQLEKSMEEEEHRRYVASDQALEDLQDADVKLLRQQLANVSAQLESLSQGSPGPERYTTSGESNGDGDRDPTDIMVENLYLREALSRMRDENNDLRRQVAGWQAWQGEIERRLRHWMEKSRHSIERE
jgi:hypothetical protein